MLRTNLSTRPFYNERQVHLLLLVIAIAVLALTVTNTLQIATLSQRSGDLTRQAEQDESRARDLTNRALAIRRGLNPAEIKTLAATAREANTLIDQRTFSWTELFNRIETTLPADVMVTSLRPDIKKGVVSVSMVVVGKRVEDIDEFMENLEGTGTFMQLQAKQEERTDDGMYRTVLQSVYAPEKG